MDILTIFDYNIVHTEQLQFSMPAHSSLDSALEEQLLLQLGERLRQARMARKLSTVVLAQSCSISRTTLHAVEAGSASVNLGTYVRVMRELGLLADLALLATGQAARTGRTILEGHAAADTQSLLMHEEAVRLVNEDPRLLERARATLSRWLAHGDTRSRPLWLQWQALLDQGTLAPAVEDSERGRQLRQASPLTTLLSPEVRAGITKQVRALKHRLYAPA
jgi:transcriptional regulator with XRE-family HTH domain